MKALNNKGFNLVGIMTAAVVGSIMVTGLNTAIFKLARSQMKISDSNDLTWLISTAQLKLKQWDEAKKEVPPKPEHTFTFPADDPHNRATVKISISDYNYEACFEAIKEAVPIPEHLKNKYEWKNNFVATITNEFSIIEKDVSPEKIAFNKEIEDIEDRCKGVYDYSVASVDCHEVNDSNPSNLLLDPDKKRQTLVGCGEGTTDKDARPVNTTLFGYKAGSKTTGAGNTFIGYKAGKENMGGSENTFFGYKAGMENTTGSKNVLIGFEVGNGNDASIVFEKDTIIGAGAGSNLVGAGNSVVIGEGAGRNTNIENSVIIGRLAAGFVEDPVDSFNSTGSVIIGREAGRETSSVNSVFIGTRAGNSSYSSPNQEGNIIIGNNSAARGSQSIVIGDGLLVGRSVYTYHDYIHYEYPDNNRFSIGHLIHGYGVNPPNPIPEDFKKWSHVRIRGDLIVDGNIILTKKPSLLKHNRYRDVDDHHHPVLTTTSHNHDNDLLHNTYSDKRLKKNIKPLSNSLSKLLKLNPSSYYWKDKAQSKKKQLGFVAQDIKKEYPELVDEGTDKKKLLSLNYIGLIPVIIKSFKEFYQSVTKSLSHFMTELLEVKMTFLKTEKKMFRELDALREENKVLLKRIENLESKKTY